MQIRSFPRPPRGGPGSRPDSVEPVPADEASVDWGGKPLRRKKKKDGSAKRRRETLLRTIAIGVLALAGMGGIAFIGLSRDRVVSDAVWRDPTVELQLQRVDVVIPLSEEKALDLVRTVLNARSVDELRGLVRLKDISAAEAVDFLAGMEKKDGKISRMNWIGNMDSNGIQIEGVEILYQKEDVRPRRALLTPDEKGTWQVDLAALAGHNTIAWDKIISEPEVHADLRVIIGHDNYYNGRFSNDREWASFAMIGAETSTLLIGYCPVESETNRALMILLRDQRAIRAIIRIRKTDASGSRQCEIVSILAEDWILTDTPFEKRRVDKAPASEMKIEPARQDP